ncbi:hypothetical protein PIIN_03146 [Serendipita indica DSM 11827]|uniref:JmjC domain-containing protein n=1 Tax=Serendipita indica (strain DSM 11827) TaxID=1109443 RepID=G4TD61_SERID|nr:hypothetical protein PIIN_03146 [Serendipita indica DSM 11827]
MDSGDNGQYFTTGGIYGIIPDSAISTATAPETLHVTNNATQAWYPPNVVNNFNDISSNAQLDHHDSDLHNQQRMAQLSLSSGPSTQLPYNPAEGTGSILSPGTPGTLTVAPVSGRKREKGGQKRVASNHDRQSTLLQVQPTPVRESSSVTATNPAFLAASGSVDVSHPSRHHPSPLIRNEVESFAGPVITPVPVTSDQQPSLGYPYAVEETRNEIWAASVPPSLHGPTTENTFEHLNANAYIPGSSSLSIYPPSIERQGIVSIKSVIYNDPLVGSNLIHFETNGIPLLIGAFPLCPLNCSLDLRREGTRNYPPATIGCIHSATLGTMCLARYISENVTKTDKANVARNSLCISEPGAATYVQGYSAASSICNTRWSIIARCDVPHALEKLEAKGISLDNQNTALGSHQFQDLISSGVTIYTVTQNAGDVLCLPPGVLYQAEVESEMEFRTWQTYSLPTVAHAFQHYTRVKHRLCCDKMPPYRRMLYGYLQAVQRSLDAGQLQSPETIEYAPGTIQQAIKLFDRLLVEEFTQGTRDHEPKLDDAGYCDFCGADIFHAAFVCSSNVAASATSTLPSDCCEVTLCPACCAEGRSCACGKLRVCSVFNFEQLISMRNRIAEWCIASLGTVPASIARSINLEDIYEDDECIHLTLGAISILHIRRFPLSTDKSDSRISMTMRCKGGPAGCEPHEVSRLQSVTCERCHDTICFPHLLAIGVHAAEAAFRLQHDRDWHYIHTTWAPRWLEWKQKCKTLSHPSDTMTRLASTEVKCHPIKATGLRLGFYDHPLPDVICEKYEDDPILGEEINEPTWNQDTRHSNAEGNIQRKRKRKTTDGTFSLKSGKKPKKKSKLSITTNISTAETTADEATPILATIPLEESQTPNTDRRRARISISSSNFDVDAEEIDVDEPIVLDESSNGLSAIEQPTESFSGVTTDATCPSSPVDHLPPASSSPGPDVPLSTQSSMDAKFHPTLPEGYLQKLAQHEETNGRLEAQVARLAVERDGLEAQLVGMSISSESNARQLEKLHELEQECQVQTARNKMLEEEVQRLKAFKMNATRELETLRRNERDYEEEKNRSKESKVEVQRLKVQLFGLRESHGKLKDELSQHIQRRDKDIESLRAENKDLKAELVSVTEQLRKYAGMLEAKNLELLSLDNDYARLAEGSSHKPSSSKSHTSRPQGTRNPITQKKPPPPRDEDEESDDDLAYNPLNIRY